MLKLFEFKILMTRDEMKNPNSSQGMLSDADIHELILSKEIVITNFNKKNLTPLGYNLTPTDFILSVRNQLLVKIHSKEFEKYCYIEPNDTVLILTRESIAVSKNIAGTFHSKVGIVSLGFGHISTTLDPLWRGPLLISLNNPTSKPIKFTLAKIEKVQDDESSDIDYSYIHKSFVTLIFHKLLTPSIIGHDNSAARFDQLKNIVQKQNKPKGWKKLLFWKSRNQNFVNLKDLIDTIGSIKYTQNTNNKHDELDIEEFFSSHKNFSELLRFYTEKAQTTTSKIIDNKIWFTKFLFFIRSITIISVIIVLYYGLWDTLGTGNTPAKVALFVSLIPLYATIIHPFLIKPLTILFGRKEST